jgi:hypothetical protein
MLNLLLPHCIDNHHRGYKLALWLFGLVVFMKTGIGLGTIFNGYNAAVHADGIPLDAFTPAGAQTVVSLFAIWGLGQAMIGLLCILALVRYRAMVPLLFSLLLLEHLSRKLIMFVLPIPRTGHPPGTYINLVLLGLMIAGLVLSLWNQTNALAKE